MHQLRLLNFLDQIKSNKVDRVDLPINFGFNHSVNHYIKDFINDQNLPQVILRMDADILVKKNDVEALIDAINHLKNMGHWRFLTRIIIAILNETY